MPLLTLHELDNLTPLFRGKAGHALARSLMCLLSVDKMNALYDRNSCLSGPPFARNVLMDLGVHYRVQSAFREGGFSFSDAELEEGWLIRCGLACSSGVVPPFITISNHPYGGIDGVILADLFGNQCPDYKLMVNKILSRVEALSPSFISVTPTGTSRTTPTSDSIIGIRRALGQLRSGGALGLFPSGAVSDFSLRSCSIRDREWQPAIVRLIAKAHVPVLPIRFFDRNSSFYYALGMIDWRVRLLRLPAELFNKSHAPLRLGVGRVITVEEQQSYLAVHTVEEFGLWLRSKVYGRKF